MGVCEAPRGRGGACDKMTHVSKSRVVGCEQAKGKFHFRLASFLLFRLAEIRAEVRKPKRDFDRISQRFVHRQVAEWGKSLAGIFSAFGHGAGMLLNMG